MKKILVILSFLGIVLLTLNSCATNKCKGGSCPIWSEVDSKSSQDFKNFKFLEEISRVHYPDENLNSQSYL